MDAKAAELQSLAAGTSEFMKLCLIKSFTQYDEAESPEMHCRKVSGVDWSSNKSFACTGVLAGHLR